MRFLSPGCMPQLYSPVTKTKASAARIFSASASMRRRRLALRVFLVHAVEHRQADRLGVDQLDVVAARLEAVDEIVRQADAHAVGAIGAVEDQYSRHCAARNSRKTGPIVTPDAEPGQLPAGPRGATDGVRLRQDGFVTALSLRTTIKGQ